MATVEDLGKQVKAKYPGQYDDLADRDVGVKVKAKFPGSYDDFEDKAIDYSKAAEPSNLQKLGTGVKDFVQGVGAGAISTGVGAYNLARKLPHPLTPPPPAPNEYVQGLTQPPDSTAGRLGKNVAQVAEFFAPTGAIGRGAKAIEGVTAGMRAAPVLNTLGRAGLEAGSAAGVTGVQTGGDPQAMKNAAAMAGGVAAGASAIGAGVRAAAPTASRIYQSALKPPLGGQLGKKAPQIVETGIREGIPTSEAGFATAGNRIDQINQQIMDGIQARQQAGMTVDLRNVTKRLNDLKERAKFMDDPEGELKAIQAVEQDFLQGHSQKGAFQPIERATEFEGFYPAGPQKQVVTSTEVPLGDAQRMKQTIGTDIRKKYGEMKAYEVEAKKQLVRGLKEEIEAVFPEVKALNRREGGLIELEESLRRFVNRENNHQLISPFTLMLGAGAATGGVASGHAAEGIGAGVFTTLLRMAMENPEIKSKIAIAARKAAQSGIPQGAAGVAQSALPKVAASASQGPPQFAHGGVVVPKGKKPGRMSKRGIWYSSPKDPGPAIPHYKSQQGPPEHGAQGRK